MFVVSAGFSEEWDLDAGRSRRDTGSSVGDGRDAQREHWVPGEQQRPRNTTTLLARERRASKALDLLATPSPLVLLGLTRRVAGSWWDLNSRGARGPASSRILLPHGHVPNSRHIVIWNWLGPATATLPLLHTYYVVNIYLLANFWRSSLWPHLTLPISNQIKNSNNPNLFKREWRKELSSH